MSWALPQALDYYGDSVAVGVATGRRSLGCQEWFGLSVGPPFVRVPLLGVPSGVEVRRFQRMSQRAPDFGSQQLSRRTDRVPADWSSSRRALPVDSLVDEPLGRCCWASFAFCRRAVVPAALSGEGVREGFRSARKAVHYLPPSSRANRRWQNHSHITRRTEESLTRGADPVAANEKRHTGYQRTPGDTSPGIFVYL